MLSRDEPAMYGHDVASDASSDDDSLESAVGDGANANEFTDNNSISVDGGDDDDGYDDSGGDENSDSLEFVDDDSDDAVHDNPTQADLAAVAAAVARIVHVDGNGSKHNPNHAESQDAADGSQTRPVTRARDATVIATSASATRSSRPGTGKITDGTTISATTHPSETDAGEDADAALDRDNVKIRVCVRKRPLGKREKKKHDADVVEVVDAVTCCINASKVAVDMTTFNQRHKFVFDEVFSEARSNEQVYKSTAAPLVRRVVEEGCMATCFAYGQTGAGKTHTMMGIPGKIDGLYLQGARDLFHKLATTEMGVKIEVMASFYEIYCGKLYDLLNGRQEFMLDKTATAKYTSEALNACKFMNQTRS